MSEGSTEMRNGDREAASVEVAPAETPADPKATDPSPDSDTPDPGTPPESANTSDTSDTSEPAKSRSDLMQRLATAAVLIPFVLWAVVHGGLTYLAIVIVIGALAQHEFYGLIEDKGAHPLRPVGLGFGAAVILVAYIGNEYHAMLLMTASLLVLMVAQLRKNEIHESMASISGTFFGVFYVAWLLSHAILLRQFSQEAGAHHDPALLVTLNLVPDSGVFLMIFTLVAIVGCDAGAYFAGRAWGRRPLAPKISPNKSLEGALGGILFGVFCAMITKLVFDGFWPDLSAALPLSVALVFGIVLCVVGIIGDLVESLLKRDAEVKDTGALLPGMGGVLDRIDAPLLGLPAMYYLMLGYIFFRSA